MEHLTTKELDREAQQTTDQVGGSQETERQGSTQIRGLSSGTRGGNQITMKQNNLHVIHIYLIIVGKREHCADVISHNDSSFQITVPLGFELS